MTYTSFSFLVFLVVLIFLYYIVPKKCQWWLLLAANVLFYLSNGVTQILFVIGSTLVTYGSTLLMQRMRDKGKDYIAGLGDSVTKEEKRELKKKNTARIKTVQKLTVTAHLLLLGSVKYLNVLLSEINGGLRHFGSDFAFPRLNILMPLGISFFTFASIGYVIDIARGKYTPEKNFFKVMLFVSFFPCIVEGPINRYNEVGVQLFEEHKFDYNRFVKGAELMLWGFFKKLVIADRASSVVATVFSADYKQYSGAQFVFAIVVFAFQIYGDFSGGIDIARGAAEILGIDLPLNFERPFFSASVQEFWRRWHITLGAWMREYVFYSVMLSKPVLRLSQKVTKKHGKFAGKIVPSTITPFVVFFLMGIWHGATFNYVLYGIYNAVVISSSVPLEPVYNKIKEKLHIKTENFSYKFFCIVRTFILVSVSRMIVKAPSVSAFGYMIKSVFTNPDFNFYFNLNGKLFSLGVDQKNMFVLFVSILILAVVSVLQENGMKIRDTLNKQSWVFRWTLLLTLLVIILVFGVYGPAYSASDFIYQAY